MGSREKGSAKMLEVFVVHCVQLDVELRKTDTVITIRITQNFEFKMEEIRYIFKGQNIRGTH